MTQPIVTHKSKHHQKNQLNKFEINRTKVNEPSCEISYQDAYECSQRESNHLIVIANLENINRKLKLQLQKTKQQLQNITQKYNKNSYINLEASQSNRSIFSPQHKNNQNLLTLNDLSNIECNSKEKVVPDSRFKLAKNKICLKKKKQTQSIYLAQPYRNQAVELQLAKSSQLIQTLNNQVSLLRHQIKIEAMQHNHVAVELQLARQRQSQIKSKYLQILKKKNLQQSNIQFLICDQPPKTHPTTKHVSMRLQARNQQVMPPITPHFSVQGFLFPVIPSSPGQSSFIANIEQNSSFDDDFVLKTQ